MKIYEAKTLEAATNSRAKQYEELKKKVVALKKEFQGIVGLMVKVASDIVIKGKIIVIYRNQK
ncbi:hypothetical protein ACFWDG_27335 [Peribacillus sp. NPDC060186]